MPEKKQDQLKADWLDVMRTEHGRRVIADIIHISGFNRSAFTGEPYATIHNNGMQKVGEYVTMKAKESPAYFVKMLEEQLNE